MAAQPRWTAAGAGRAGRRPGSPRPRRRPRFGWTASCSPGAAERLRVQGVTYGPFPPGPDGHPFPTPERVADDFARMREVGVNAVRTYHVPPEWFFHLADEAGVSVFVDVPWPKHLCFLDSERAQARRPGGRRAGRQGGPRPPVGPGLQHRQRDPDRRRPLARPAAGRAVPAELADVAKQADPDRLVTYASFPPTEYLDLSFLDFATFNVYLHDREAFRRYLFRLQNLVGDRPLRAGRAGHGHAAARRARAGRVPGRAPGRGPADGAGRGVRLLLDRRVAHRRPPDRGLGVRRHPRRPLARRRPTTPCARCSRGRPADAARRGPAGVGRRLHVQRRADPGPVPAVARRAGLPRLRGDRGRRRLDRRHPRDRRPVPRRSGPSTSRTGA